MRTDSRNTLLDGFRTLSGGVDSGREPDLIRDDQVSFAVNATFRGGSGKTRPGYRKRGLQFLDFAGDLDTTLRDAFEDGLWQGAAYMDQFNYGGVLVAQVSGRTYRVDVLKDFAVTDLTIEGQVTTTADFVIPAVAGTVGVGVTRTTELVLGETLSFGVGTYTVSGISGLNLTLTNLTGTPLSIVPRGTLVIRAGVSVTFTDRNSSTRPRAWLEQAEDFMVIQDGQSKPLIYDGAVLRRADSEGLTGSLIAGTTDRFVREVPVGTVMAYSNGRLWVALSDGHSFVASDLTGGPTGTPAYSERDAVLKFSENDIIAEGGSFGVPVTAGPITAMCSIANLDTSLGQGPLQVFTSRCAFSVNAPFDRTTWKDLQYPIQTVSALAYGALSNESTINVNSDIWYRASDGVRSFQVARRDSNTWATTPLSREMNRMLEYDDRHQLDRSSAVVFDNRLLMTCSPERVPERGVTHRALAVLDFDRASALLERLPPAWEGVWTGVSILQIVAGEFEGVHRAFAFVLSGEDKIELWEITRDAHFDTSDLDVVDRRITSIYETRSFGFTKDNGWGLKELATGVVWVDEVSGSVRFDVAYRPDQHPCWVDWHTWSANATYKDCNPLDCLPTEYALQYRPYVRLPAPADGCDEITDKPYKHGYEFQVRFIITGHVRLKRFLLVAVARQDEILGACPP